MIKEPLFFERNRVGRVYTGGKLFAGFFGDPPEDGYEPEEWIASGVRAINAVSKGPKEGVSRVKDTDLYLDDLLQAHSDELLGKGNKLRILVKALDSAVRLPAQAHPDKAFSLKHFGSRYGKTECWLILDTRPDAKLFFGFKDGVTEADFRRAIEDSQNDKDAMERLMQEVRPQPGEVYFVPARTVHAIGAGCLILEVQEPTDFTIQPEHYCGEYKLSEQEMYMGLSPEVAVSCFDFREAPEAKLIPQDVQTGDGVTKVSLVGPEVTDCFVINRLDLDGGAYTPALGDQYAIYIVTDGQAVLSADKYEKKLKKGDYFFMPAVLMGKFRLSGKARIVECY